MLCAVVGVLLLTACSRVGADSRNSLDLQQAAYISQITEVLLQDITSMDEAEVRQYEEDLLEFGENGLASGVTAWLGVMKDTGAFVGVLSSETELSEDKGFVSTIQAQFENRNAEFKVFYSMERQTQSLNPVSISISPEYTIGEKMVKAVMNTMLGMGTVFLVLIFISLIIGSFKFIYQFEKKMSVKETTADSTLLSAPEEVSGEELADDLELVAVITAAVAAVSDSPTDGLVVRSIKRAPGAKWKRA